MKKGCLSALAVLGVGILFAAVLYFIVPDANYEKIGQGVAGLAIVIGLVMALTGKKEPKD